MGKKMYIPVKNNGKSYKLYMDDIYKIHSISKIVKPPLPLYDDFDCLRKF
jgi:hypothetical protein